MSHARPRLAMLAAIVGATALGGACGDPPIPAPVFEVPRPPSSNQRKRRMRAKRALSHRLGRKGRVR